MTKSLPEVSLENIIARSLRVGVILSMLIVFTGGLLYLLSHGMDAPNYGQFAANQSLADTGQQLIQLGLLILIATPVFRVGLSLYVFARTGDRIYVMITSIVLTILIYSLFKA